MKLSPSVQRKLGHYVYLYVDPFDDKVFYVGKGTGDRAFVHLNDISESRKAAKIKEIKTLGREPRVEILVHGLEDEAMALRIEAAVVDLLGMKNLTNNVRGWRSSLYGRMEINHLASIYEQEPVKVDEPAILIRISQLFHHGMSPVELYDATRGIWKIGKNREKARYAFAIYEGVVREVYEIKQWFLAGTTFSTRNPEGVQADDRWEFVGILAPKKIRKKYVGKSVAHYFSKNSQSPIIYINVE